MGCKELKITDYYRFLEPDEKSYSRAGEIPCTAEKNRYKPVFHTVISNYRYYSPELGRWLTRDPIGEDGGWNLYWMVVNNPILLWDYRGLSCYKKKFDCQKSTWHGEVGGGALAYVGVSYDYNEESCKCCRSDCTVGTYWSRKTTGTITISAGAGFDVDVGDINWNMFGEEFHLDLAFHFSVTTIGINHPFSHDMEESNCDGTQASSTKICWNPNLDLGLKNIGIGNNNFGLFASAHSTFNGEFCVAISKGGVSFDSTAFLTINISVNAMIGGKDFGSSLFPEDKPFRWPNTDKYDPDDFWKWKAGK